ncbi:MAG: hypothetical protein LC803_10920 [Acidobacteria bacterium]|nr:hypothetical protein [Acidobacteriota bacterium]
MERLKNLDEVYLPDANYRNRFNIDEATGVVTEMGVETIYEMVENVRLNANIPESVRSHFETAKNLILYAWFVYSFNAVAALQAFASLEMAVREKTGDYDTAFKKLLDRVFPGRELAPNITLSKAVTNRRNDLAHGSLTISGQEIIYLRACANLINELYP